MSNNEQEFNHYKNVISAMRFALNLANNANYYHVVIGPLSR